MQTDKQANRAKRREQQSAAERTGLSILRYVLDHPSATRRDTAEDLQLSFPNVCRLVAGFQKQGILVEQDLKQTGRRGPQSKTLSLRADLGCTIGVDLESTHVRGIVLDFSNEIRAVYRRPVTAEADGEEVVALVSEVGRSLVRSASGDGLDAYAVGLALPGPVLNEGLGRVRTELQRGRTEMEFVPRVQRECKVETYAAANDICFALGHHRMHPLRASSELIVLNRFGVSAAVVHESEARSGHLGLLPYGTDRPMLHYRDVCTGGSILRLARSRGDTRPFQELVSSLDDPLVKEWLARAVPAFAQAVYSAAMMYAPTRIIIDGIFCGVSKETRSDIRRMVETEMSGLGMTPPEISFFEGDDLMGARGAAFAARDHVADEVIGALVRAGRNGGDE